MITTKILQAFVSAICAVLQTVELSSTFLESVTAAIASVSSYIRFVLYFFDLKVIATIATLVVTLHAVRLTIAVIKTIKVLPMM